MSLPDSILRVEPTPRWIRVKFNGEWVADTRSALLLVWFGPDRLPTYCIPDDDMGYAPGVEEVAEQLEGLEEPFAAANGYWTFPWGDERVEWYEEATQVFVHSRDPQKRVDVLPSARHVRVEIDGEVVAESRRPVALFETWLPTRWYFQPGDVRLEALRESSTSTACPYKGTARYWSHPSVADVAWSYPDPIPECPGIKGLIAFFNEKVDLVVDGERLERPQTPWS